jgi:hypothetical protein
MLRGKSSKIQPFFSIDINASISSWMSLDDFTTFFAFFAPLAGA